MKDGRTRRTDSVESEREMHANTFCRGDARALLLGWTVLADTMLLSSDTNRSNRQNTTREIVDPALPSE